MKEIPLTRGVVAIVDDEDYATLSFHKWCATPIGRGNSFYAVRGVWSNGTTVRAYMHRVILCPPSGMHVDHISGDGLDNRRANLRLATYAQNNQNCRVYQNNKSGYKGVRWNRRDKRWLAEIRANGLRKYIGLFDSPAEAHAAYCAAAKELHGEFARFA